MSFHDFFESVAFTETILFLIGTVTIIYTFAKGILPAVWRLGNGLAKRKIAVFARGDNAASLRALLVDSKLLNAKT